MDRRHAYEEIELHAARIKALLNSVTPDGYHTSLIICNDDEYEMEMIRPNGDYEGAGDDDVKKLLAFMIGVRCRTAG